MDRYQGLLAFAEKTLGTANPEMELVSGDASFRKYYRCQGKIFVDAPPATEKNAEFVRNAELLKKAGICAPEVLACDLENGYMCVSDLGSVTFANAVTSENMAQMYMNAVDAALAVSAMDCLFEPYDDAFIDRELLIFKEWYLEKHCGTALSGESLALWEETCKVMRENNSKQPHAAMHRDFHGRNLMIKDGRIAVIDFQDMVAGPVTYDLVSLLRDCYFTLPVDLHDELLSYAHAKLCERGVYGADKISLREFRNQYAITGAQRHLKAMGIFCRLFYRDGKDAYFRYLDRTLGYVENAAVECPELAPLKKLLKSLTLKRA